MNTTFEAMAELEGICGGLASVKISKEALNELDDLRIRMSDMAANKAYREYDTLNSTFHTLIYRASGNQILAETASDMRLKLAPFNRSRVYSAVLMQTADREHHLIVQLLAARNTPGVQEALRQHLVNARQAVVSLPKQEETWPMMSSRGASGMLKIPFTYRQGTRQSTGCSTGGSYYGG